MDKIVTGRATANDFVDVRLIGITKSYGDGEVVRDLDLVVKRGEFFSLLGPSGCGKTTTLRMIAGLERPTRGVIEIGGRIMNDLPINRRPTNLIFQKLALFPHLDVFENIAFGLRLRKIALPEIRRRVAAILETVDLIGFERRAIAAISGGQQQRVAIARAVINEPTVLLLDEPLGALDLKLQLRLQEELKAIQRRLALTFIYVTHNQTEALAMSDRVAVMNAGRLEQVGAPTEIYRQPATSFVASFVGQTNLLQGRVEQSHDGRVILAAAGLRFSAPGAARIGDRAAISVRPEHLRITASVSNAAHNAALRLLDTIFLGPSTMHRVASPDGTVILAEAAGSQELLQPGSEIVMSWDDDVAIILHGEAGQ